MVMKMNKYGFIKELSNQTGYEEENCKLINSIIEDSLIIGKKNKEKMIEKFEMKLNFDKIQSNNLYETVMNILGKEIKNKLKHPFKSEN